MQDAHPATAEDASRTRVIVGLLLFAGLALRLYFLHWQAFLASDSLIYQNIAQNWLHAHVYGLSTDFGVRPTMIRLPGYPAILAVCSWLFDGLFHSAPGTMRSFLPVLWLQIFADLATCCLAAATVYRMAGRRAALATLTLACLCPFTANYSAFALTETFTLFFVALTYYALLRWLAAGTFGWLTLLAVALAYSILLRPDQGLLAAAVIPVLIVAQSEKQSMRQQLLPALLCCTMVALPFVPWTLRNLHTFGVFQPLSPKLAVDPGEPAPTGFQRWFRTWGVDFTATQDAYWTYPDEAVVLDNMPGRAFDSPAQRERTVELLQQAAITHKLNPEVEAGFAALAIERIHAHRLRYYVVLPIARLTNMLLHPRTEMLPVNEPWWDFQSHPGRTVFAWLYAGLNLAYMIAAGFGWLRLRRMQPLLAWSMLTYVALRCALLMTLDNSEQRYTLEFFPLYFVCAGMLFTGPKNTFSTTTVIP
jgi:4-amino-4-deoxy-L-arabinose transferase-like glycosyltransferase